MNIINDQGCPIEVFAPGIPDECFLRGDVPMTKAEVRAITMSKARLRDGMRVLDIGAGTGSFSIEAAMLCQRGEVVAVERDPDALALLRRNIAHFGLSNIIVVEGEAPEALEGMSRFDRIFLGGTGGRMGELLESLPRFLRKGGRVVSNTIGLESTVEVELRLRKEPWTNWEMVQVSISRGVPIGASLVRFEPLNPVWVVAADL